MAQPELLGSSSPSLVKTQRVYSMPQTTELDTIRSRRSPDRRRSRLTQKSLDVCHYRKTVANLEKRLLDRDQLLEARGVKMEALPTEHNKTITEKNEVLEHMTRAQNDDDVVRFLPVEILRETFLHLNTVDQWRMREVCPGWNRILASAAKPNKRLLHIQFPLDPSRSFLLRRRSSSEGKVFIAAACAARCRRTCLVAIVGFPVPDDAEDRNYYLPLCDELTQILPREPMHGGAEKKLWENLVLKDAICGTPNNDDEDYIARLHRSFDSLAAMCRTMTVTNFTCRVGTSMPDGFQPLTVRITFARISHDRRLTVADWWDMIEQGCPLLDDLQRDLVSTTLKKTDRSFELSRGLYVIWRYRQLGDPRKCRTFGEAPEFGPSPLNSIDVDKLTRMVQYQMYCAIIGMPLSHEVTGPA
ncbi:uncharacterized protein LOC129597518 [Paramacrobiotus metropolitanus]|uniref:uncharacterized protein LOC129597518 n=1 Tax=Paramacrobiotus metropolitanus TaxID=2943436 RepID=UPI0024460A92|nr:uncharacterized protein LOC129597518 [Paramacrobiotus metropolitanus]